MTAPASTRFTHPRVVQAEGFVHGWLMLHSITVLRIAMGLVFLGFGVLKFVPGLSPAGGLVEATITRMTFGIVPPEVGLVTTALLECAIGISLITRRWLRLTVYLLVLELAGILSPLVLLPGRMFSGPHHAPSLEGQYVLKDIVLVAAAMVIATQFRGARMTADEGWVPAVPEPAPAAPHAG
jgi:uncharacterized membrane protein YkgB